MDGSQVAATARRATSSPTIIATAGDGNSIAQEAYFGSNNIGNEATATDSGLADAGTCSNGAMNNTATADGSGSVASAGSGDIDGSPTNTDNDNNTASASNGSIDRQPAGSGGGCTPGG